MRNAGKFPAFCCLYCFLHIFDCMKKWLIIGLVAVGLTGLYYYEVGKIQSFLKIRFNGLAFDNGKSKDTLYTTLFLTVFVTLTNPSELSLMVNSIAVDVLYNGRKVGTVEKIGYISLIANSENRMALNIAVPTLMLFGTVEEAIKAVINKQPISLQLKGIVNTSSGPIPINQTLDAYK